MILIVSIPKEKTEIEISTKNIKEIKIFKKVSETQFNMLELKVSYYAENITLELKILLHSHFFFLEKNCLEK